MSEPLLDLRPTARDEQDWLWMPDGAKAFLVDKDQLGPRDFAKVLTAANRAQDVDKDEIDEADMLQLEEDMTDAACLVLPDEPRERVDALSYFQRAGIVEVFFKGLQKGRSPEEEEEQTSES